MGFFQDVNEVDIVQLIEKHVSLKKAGANYTGLCPFHKEKSPSFVVKPSTNTWHCYGCGEGFSAIDFIMKLKNKTPWESAVEIANDNAIEIPKMTEEAKETASQKEALYNALSLAQRFFVENLKATDAKKYLLGRWDEKVISEWGFGYAPDGFSFVEYCKLNKITDQCLSLGLLKKNEKGVVYSHFRDRITIPIQDKSHRLIGYTSEYIGKTKKASKKLNTLTLLRAFFFTKTKYCLGLTEPTGT